MTTINTLILIVKLSIQMIKKDGEYISYAKGQENNIPTTANTIDPMVAEALLTEAPAFPADIEAEAKAIVEWAKTMDTRDNDYLNRLHEIATDPTDLYDTDAKWPRGKNFGLAASLPVAYTNSKKFADTTDDSAHFGSKKERLTFDVTLERVHGFEGYYGWTNIFVFRTTDGNLAVWKTGTDLPIDIVEFDGVEVKNKTEKTFTITATVKEHTDYRGTKQTLINRVKVAPLTATKAA